MHRIKVENKLQIRQLLYSGCLLGVKDSQYQAFGGFQVWWYDKKADRCHSAESHWLDRRKQVNTCRLDKAVKILWHKRGSLFLSVKHVSEDNKLKVLKTLGIAHFGNSTGGR